MCLSKSTYIIFKDSKYYPEFTKFNIHCRRLYYTDLCKLGMINTLKSYMKDHQINNITDCILTTVKYGNLETLKYILSIYNYVDYYTYLLHHALVCNELEIIKYFVSLNVNIEFEINTIIRYSIKFLRLKIIKYLIFLNIKFRNEFMLKNIFNFVIKHGSSDILKYLYSLTHIKSKYEQKYFEKLASFQF